MTFGNDATDRGTGTTRFRLDRVVGAIETLEWLLPEEQPTLECQAAPLYDGRLLADLCLMRALVDPLLPHAARCGRHTSAARLLKHRRSCASQAKSEMATLYRVNRSDNAIEQAPPQYKS